jgi:hypothetical protein
MNTQKQLRPAMAELETGASSNIAESALETCSHCADWQRNVSPVEVPPLRRRSEGIPVQS